MGTRLLQSLSQSITQERTVLGCPPVAQPPSKELTYTTSFSITNLSAVPSVKTNSYLVRPVSASAHPLVGLAAAAQEESNDCLSFYIYAHIPLQCHPISKAIHRLGRELHLITLLQPSFLCDLEFVNHTVSHTSARTTSPHQALPRRPLSPPHQKEQLKSFCSLIICALNNNSNKNQETIPEAWQQAHPEIQNSEIQNSW